MQIDCYNSNAQFGQACLTDFCDHVNVHGKENGGNGMSLIY